MRASTSSGAQVRTGGHLKDRIRFEQRALDASGDRTGAWVEVCTIAAEVNWLKGSEPVMAQRLQGIRPALLAVRSSALTRSIDNSFRAVDARIGSPKPTDYFAIRGASPTADRHWVEILAELGADG